MAFTLDELRRATALLERIVGERGLLADLPEPDRRAFLTAAGQVSRPDTYQERRLARAFRRKRRERAENQEDVRRDAGKQSGNVNDDSTEQDIDRVEARRRNPFQILRRMMDGMDAPQMATVKCAMDPVQAELGTHEVKDELKNFTRPSAVSIPSR